ncbi:hypothetical protein [Vibrio sp. HN007]|uniref:hypothetical protein n=1 Tax=Vibrio iocasae TaxID=3098914 RepID=UPI0035D49EFF
MKSKLFASVAACFILVMAALPAQANTQKFISCTVDSLSVKDKHNLARWIFFSIAAHPQMGEYSKITDSDRLATDKKVGRLITKLLVDDCPDELRVANKEDPYAVERAFEYIGQVAMQELLTAEEVNNAITGYIEYTDQDALEELISE